MAADIPGGSNDVQIGINVETSQSVLNVQALENHFKGLDANIAAVNATMAKNAGVVSGLTSSVRGTSEAVAKFTAYLERQVFAVQNSAVALKAYDLGLDQTTALAHPLVAELNAVTIAMERQAAMAKAAAADVKMLTEAHEASIAANYQQHYNDAAGINIPGTRQSARSAGEVTGEALEELVAKQNAAATSVFALGEALQTVGEAQVKGYVNQLGRAVEAAAKTVLTQEKFIESLKLEAATVGMTRAELRAFQAAQLGLSANSEVQSSLSALEQGLGKVKSGASKAHGSMAGFVRETFILLREAGRGDFSRMAGSFTIWVDRLRSALPAMFGVTVGLIALAAATAATITLLDHSKNEFTDLSNEMRATGNAAGMTTSKFIDMADKVHNHLGVTRGSVKDLERQMVMTGKIGSQSFEVMVNDAELLARAMGIKPQDALKEIEALTGDVAKAAADLNSKYHFLTEAQWLQINAMEVAGDKSGALQVALDALNKHLEGTTQKTGLLESAVRGVIGVWDEFLAKLQAIDNPTATQKLQQLKDDLAAANKGPNANSPTMLDRDGNLISKADVERQISDIGRTISRQNQRAESQKKTAESTQRAIEIDQTYGKGVTALTKAQDDLAFSTKQLSDAKIALAGASSEADKKAAQAAITNAENNIKAENLAIKKAQRKIDGPAGPKPTGMASPLETDRAKLEQELNDKRLFNDKALELEKTFWANIVATTATGTAEHQAAVKAQQTAELAIYKRSLDLQLTKDQDTASLRDQAIQDQVEADTGALDLQIQTAQDELSAMDKYKAKDLQNLKDLYNKRLEIVNQGVRDQLEAQLAGIEAKKAYDTANGDDVSLQQDIDAEIAIRRSANAQILKNEVKTAHDIEKINSDATKRTLDRYKSMATKISDSFRTTIEGLIEKTTTWGDVWIGMQRKMLDFTLRALQEMLIKHVLTNKFKALSDKLTADETGKINFKQILVQIKNDAVAAASGAYKATVSIPVVGPFLAPIAAATAFAAVATMESGVAAFSAERGMGEVPYDNAPFLLHKKEMVLPANLATPLRNMLTSGGSSTSNTTNNRSMGDLHVHVHPAKGESAKSVVQVLKSAYRQNEFILAGA